MGRVAVAVIAASVYMGRNGQDGGMLLWCVVPSYGASPSVRPGKVGEEE